MLTQADTNDVVYIHKQLHAAGSAISRMPSGQDKQRFTLGFNQILGKIRGLYFRTTVVNLASFRAAVQPYHEIHRPVFEALKVISHLNRRLTDQERESDKELVVKILSQGLDRKA